MSYIAHKCDDGRKQSVKDHLTNTANMAAGFAQAFGAEKLAFQCGLYHDIGKYSSEFQDYINGGSCKRVDHSTAGAILMAENRGRLAQAFCIAGHHAGLPDHGSPADKAIASTLYGRLKRKIPAYENYLQEIEKPLDVPAPEISIKDKFSFMLFIRMLFSSLVDADYLDAERFEKNGINLRDGFEDMNVIADRFLERLANKDFDSGSNEINQERKEILQRCLSLGSGKQGLYTLTVPTGGGKTCSSTAFAMRHCQAHHLRRIIYVIPYTSVIDQTSSVLRELVNHDDVDNVIEHHSAIDYNDEDESMSKARLATENWDAPIIVTTNVQFFESLFACRASRCRKLHNISQSVIIFDEAQMIPIAFIKPIIKAIAELTKNYGCTCLLTSATQPPWKDMFSQYQADCQEISTGIPLLYKAFERTSQEFIGEVTGKEVADRLSAYERVVCIVTTKRKAKEIFEELPKDDGNFYLSTNLCSVHRKRIIREIRERLRNKKPCRVVSTSVISVGVDLDFPVGFVEVTALDSILQASGRVNRGGEECKEDSMVYIFSMPYKSSFMKQERDTTEYLIKTREKDIFSPEAIEEYYKLLFYLRGNNLDTYNIGGLSERLAFREISEKFKLINEPTTSIVIPHSDKLDIALAQLRHKTRSRRLLRMIAPYIVNVRNQNSKNHLSDFDRLRSVGALEILDEGLAVLRENKYYDEIQGLMVPDIGEAIFS